MGFLTRQQSTPRERVEPVMHTETRRGGVWAADGWGAGALGGGGQSRLPVATHLAESLSAVLGCVELISSTLGSLPASIVVDSSEGREPAPATLPACRLIARPNARQSWPAFMTMLGAQLLLHGNAVCWVRMDGRGAVTSLTPLPWSWLSPQMINGASGPRLVFAVLAGTPEAQLLGLPTRLLDTDVLHVRARSDTGIIGRSVLARAAGVIHEGLQISTLAQANWRNGMRPSGFLATPDYLKGDQVQRAQATLEQYVGAVNAGKVPLLEGGWQFKQLSLNSVDAEFLATRQFSAAEVARMFCVPEPMIQVGQRPPGDMQPYLAAFAQLALAPIVNAIEAEFDSGVLPAGTHLQLDMSGMLRGNYSAVAAANCAQVQSGIMTPNDARRAIGLPAHDAGSDLRVGAAPNWPADAPGMPSLAPKPGHSAGGIPHAGTHNDAGAQ